MTNAPHYRKLLTLTMTFAGQVNKIKLKKGINMKQNISKYQFTEAFKHAGRQDQFSYAGLKALFEYLEEYEESTGEEIELDVIALCCDYSEYSSAKEACEEATSFNVYNVEGSEEEIEEACLEYLRDNTQVVHGYNNNNVIIASF